MGSTWSRLQPHCRTGFYRAVFHHPRQHLCSFTVCAFTFWNQNLATRPQKGVVLFLWTCKIVKLVINVQILSLSISIHFKQTLVTNEKQKQNQIHHMGVSINGGTPKMMVCNGKSIYKWIIWGYPSFRKPPYSILCTTLPCRSQGRSARLCSQVQISLPVDSFFRCTSL